MVSHASVIEALGGRRPLAEALGVKPEIAIHWHRRGIPAKFWHKVATLAAAKNLSVTADDLARTKPAMAESA